MTHGVAKLRVNVPCRCVPVMCTVKSTSLVTAESASANNVLSYRHLDAGACIIRYISDHHPSSSARIREPVYTHCGVQGTLIKDDFPQYDSDPARSISGRIDHGFGIQCKPEAAVDSCTAQNRSSVAQSVAYVRVTFMGRWHSAGGITTSRLVSP